MIGKTPYMFCKDPLYLIENYEEAVNSPEKWDCHHRLEIELNLLRKELIEQDLYYNRPASELIFLTKAEHMRLHNTGENSPMYGECLKDHMTPEAYKERNRNISKANKGNTPWNKGLKGAQEAWNKGISPSEESKQKNREAHLGKPSPIKGKKRYTREDGTHYYA